MSTVLVYLADEHNRELIKTALASHTAMIVTQDRTQCLEAVRQKAAIHKAFIGVKNEKGRVDLKLFEEISVLDPDLKVIAVGDHDTEDSAAEAVRRGAAGHMIMPAEASALLTLAR